MTDGAAARGGRRAGRRDDDLHADVLHRLVAGAAGATTTDLHLLYEALAPVLYRGTTTSPVARRWRRRKLRTLVERDVVAVRDTPRGRVWVPLELPDGVELSTPATGPLVDGDGDE